MKGRTILLLLQLLVGAATAETEAPEGGIAPCQPQPTRVTETTAQLDCPRQRQPPSASPPRLSLELRKLGGAGGGEPDGWATRLSSVTQLPLALDGLRPYTTYQVRFVSWTAENKLNNVGYPSNFTTMELQAAPSTPPEALTPVWPTPSVLRVTWRQPARINARLTGYSVQLEHWLNPDGTGPANVALSEFSRRPEAQLTPPDCATAGCLLELRVAAVNAHGTGPWARLTLPQAAAEAPNQSHRRSMLILLTGGVLKTVEVPGVPRYSRLTNGNATDGIVG